MQHNGHTDAQNALQKGFLRPKVTAMERKPHAAAGQDHGQRKHNAQRLRKCGAQRSAHRAKAQKPHKIIIQHDIGKARGGNKKHGGFAVAHAAEDRADDIVRYNKRNTEKANRQIILRARNRSIGGGNQAHNAPARQQQKPGQCQRKCGKQHNGVSNDPADALFIAAAHSPGNAYGGAHGQPNHHHSDHVHHL